MWGMDNLSNNPGLSQIFTLLQTGQYATGAQRLASQARYFFDGLASEVINDLVSKFSLVLVKQTPDLLYLQAILSVRTGEQQKAIDLFQHAKAAYSVLQQQQQVIRCYLELAQIYYQREGAVTTYHYLCDEVQPFIDFHKVNDATLQADFFLQMAHILFEMGQIVASKEDAEQALALYNILPNPYGQFYARLRIAATDIQAGKYAAAQENLQHVGHHLRAHNLGALAEARWLHVQAHLEWYQWKRIDALHTAQGYVTLADTEVASSERVYARVLLGNLYRDLGQFRMAHSWYIEAAKLIKEVGYPSYLPQIHAQLAWVYLLEGRLSNTRALIETSQSEAVPVQIMNFQVILAVLHMLDGEWDKAAKLLHEALAFYKKTHNPLACCAIHLYLTYNALHYYETPAILVHLEQGFSWLANHQITTYPHWWHPKIVAEVCAHALISNLYPELAEHILVHHLGKTSVPVLKLLEKTEDIDLRRKVYSLQQSIIGPEANYLAHLADTPSKQVLQELLARGELRPDAYSRLEHELTTAQHRHSPNPTILAVFGLYIAGVNRNQIAKQLECSVENVRNYVTVIYQHFNLPAAEFKGRELRRQKLIKLAREHGFIH